MSCIVDKTIKYWSRIVFDAMNATQPKASHV